MTQQLAIRELKTPAEVVANATEQAKVLMDIVNQTHCYQTISGKKYLQVEAWEAIGAFNRVHAVTDSIIPIMRDEELVGYNAKVNLLNQDGFVVGCAIMPCYFTENACKGKEGDAKDKACKSAAQTFASSKAYRMNYSYIAILAGYEPTPAEEMTGSDTTQPNRNEHFCEAHGVPFFKKGRMRGYSHPIEGTNPVEWCHEHKEEPKKPQQAPPEPAESLVQPAPEKQGTRGEYGESPAYAAKKERERGKAIVDILLSKIVEPEQEASPFDADWLKETLKIIHWTEVTVKSWIKAQFKVPVEGTLVEVLKSLERDNLEAFFNHIRLMRESAGE